MSYLMAVGPNPKNFSRIAESRFGYLKVCSLLEQRQYKNDSTEFRCMLVLKLPPFFPHRVKKRGNFKTNIHLDSVESFLYYISSTLQKDPCHLLLIFCFCHCHRYLGKKKVSTCWLV